MKALLFGAWNTDLGLLLMRIVFGGFMMFGHGLGKLSGFAERMDSFPDPLGVGSTMSLALAVGAEFFAAFLVILGLATRAALVPLVITMVVAGFIIHGADPFQKQELALIYLAAYIVLFLTGPGKYSVDNKLANKGS